MILKLRSCACCSAHHYDKSVALELKAAHRNHILVKNHKTRFHRDRHNFNRRNAAAAKASNRRVIVAVAASLDHEIAQRRTLHKECIEHVRQLRDCMDEEEDDEQRLQLHEEAAVADKVRANALTALREVRRQRAEIHLPKGTRVRNPVGVTAPGLPAGTPALPNSANMNNTISAADSTNTTDTTTTATSASSPNTTNITTAASSANTTSTTVAASSTQTAAVPPKRKIGADFDEHNILTPTRKRSRLATARARGEGI
jgi:hypothetical protein